MLRRIRHRQAFTLIELLVVIVILAILMAIAIPAYLSQQQKARKTRADVQLNIAYRAAASSLPENSQSFDTGATLVNTISASEPELAVSAATTCSGVAGVSNLNTVVVNTRLSSTRRIVLCAPQNSGVEMLSATTTGGSAATATAAGEIIYPDTACGGGHICVYSAYDDGSGSGKLIYNGWANDLNISPDRTKALIWDAITNNIVVFDFSGKQSVSVASSWGGSFAPDGTIIYSKNGNEVWQMNSDGTNQHKLFTVASVTRVVDPSYNLAMTTVLFKCLNGGVYDLCTSDNSGTATHILVAGASPQGYDYPSWSPDGTKILFTYTDGSSVQHVETANPDGSGVANLVTGISGAYSPDGTKILYYSGAIKSMNTDGSGQATVANVGSGQPVW